METYQIDILNPKALKLLKDLADLKLISIRKRPVNKFLEAVSEIRKGADNVLSVEEITKEVETVRTERHAGKQVQDNN